MGVCACVYLCVCVRVCVFVCVCVYCVFAEAEEADCGRERQDPGEGALTHTRTHNLHTHTHKNHLMEHTCHAFERPLTHLHVPKGTHLRPHVCDNRHTHMHSQTLRLYLERWVTQRDRPELVMGKDGKVCVCARMVVVMSTSMCLCACHAVDESDLGVLHLHILIALGLRVCATLLVL